MKNEINGLTKGFNSNYPIRRNKFVTQKYEKGKQGNIGTSVRGVKEPEYK